MNTRTLVALSLFVGIGATLHLLLPGTLSMKPDMSLLMMFLGILLFPGVKNVLLLGIATGLLSGLTTTFPGGFLPNLIDKPITAFLFYGLVIAAAKYSRTIYGAAILTAVGTVISGTLFLGSAALIVGLPAPILALAVTAVLPAIILNGLLMGIMYPVVQTVMKRSSLMQPAV
ncbi:tryptophan transporter [Jeotgalibacillus proteolyticus]|uniref:Tryptophan transporter n=1 Tax=Jeotgalibacillus proteolyticus TaxID=2082395 RepID=A0A2S5GHM0_9BACL|nr:tryptophan transporter [Jeotgalibacillus proteolyticus]PPA72405.1 tryptophan transporter [Jeotgalibacillus proteolyticus]